MNREIIICITFLTKLSLLVHIHILVNICVKAIKYHVYENIQRMLPFPASQFPGPSRITGRSECPSPCRNPLQGHRPHLPVTARAPARRSRSSKSTQHPLWPLCPAFSPVTADWSEGARTSGQTLSWLCLRGCFWMR